jgi:hypothetical protein
VRDIQTLRAKIPSINSNFSYMDQLLRDGGDLDSMDRSLLDYGNTRVCIAHQQQQQQQHTSGRLASQVNGHQALPPPPHTAPCELSTPETPNTAVILSPATPPATPVTSPEGVPLQPVIKRDLVVRFTEQQNSVKVHHVMMSESGRGGNNHSAPPHIITKEHYEAHHYTRHPHGPTSPCQSENSVCTRSRETLNSQGKHRDEVS